MFTWSLYFFTYFLQLKIDHDDNGDVDNMESDNGQFEDADPEH